MKKILLPIDGSPRSLRTIQTVKQIYSPDEVEITILSVIGNAPRIEEPADEPVEHPPVDEEVEEVADPQAEENARLLMDSFARMLPEYKVEIVMRRGSPGPTIVHFAEEGKFDSILMTRSSRGPMQKLGSVATYIVRNASFITTTVLREGL